MTTAEKIEFLKGLPSETISPKVLALVAGGDPYSYNIAAKKGELDIPHFWRGRNLRIWKGPVIRLIGGSNEDIQSGRRTESPGEDDRREAV